MKTENWNKLNEIFHKAKDLSGKECEKYLEKICENDTSLREEVENLLASSKEEKFLEEDVFVAGTQILLENESLQGKTVGNYKLIEEIGRGGMGAVYLAERSDKEFDQKVAVKIIHNQIVNESLLQRFKNERQILAKLEHPNIAHLIDGGTTENGLPYFVMEYVEGESLLKFCDKNKLTTNQRLKLFCQICSAVAFAHKNLIIHRDIKSSNILVTKESLPKLLDFGIAKPVNEDNSFNNNTLTKPGDKLLTPDYASPEQIKGESVTTATDVYSLGVVLYELLTGHLPFDLDKESPLEIYRIICEDEPKKPSTIIGNTKEVAEKDSAKTETLSPQTVSKARNTKPDSLRQQLSGDLDTILLKSLRKEPERRYSSVEQFCDDIERHLEGLPVSARPDKFGYVAEKFIKRNKIAVLASSLAALALISAFVITFIQNKRITEQRNIAQQQRQQAEEQKTKAERVSAFMVDLFKGSKAKKEGEEITAKEILIRGSERVMNDLEDDSEFKASLLDTMANAAINLGLYERALKMSRLSFEIRKQNFGEEHPETIRSLDNIYEAEFERANYKEAEDIARKIVKLKRKVFGESPELAESLNDFGAVLSVNSKTEEAEKILKEGIELSRKLVKNNPKELGMHTTKTYFTWAKPVTEIELAYTLRNYAAFLYGQGKYRQASEPFNESFEIFKKNKDSEPSGFAYISDTLGLLNCYLGNFETGEAQLNEAISIRTKLHGGKHSLVSYSLSKLGICQYQKGDLNSAEKNLSKAMQLREKISSKKHPHYPPMLIILSMITRDKGNAVLAKELLKEARGINQQIGSKDKAQSGRAKVILGSLLKIENNQTEKLIKKGLAELQKHYPSEHWLIAEAKGELGIFYLKAGQNKEAEKFLEESYNHLKKIRSENAQETRRVQEALKKLKQEE